MLIVLLPLVRIHQTHVGLLFPLWLPWPLDSLTTPVSTFLCYSFFLLSYQLEILEQLPWPLDSLTREWNCCCKHITTSSKSKKGSDRRTAKRWWDAIASWVAHELTDGQVPIEKIQIHLVNHIVQSLCQIPEHKDSGHDDIDPALVVNKVGKNVLNFPNLMVIHLF